ncbi:MAG: 3-oxoacyl-ACP synthase [Bacteroidales bacterium]|nr:3-oxoacyl-ACP synthase [Bacteroidales bacterium]
MIFNIGDNIVSPLGWTTAENWSAAAAEQTGLRPYSHHFGLPEPFFASLLDEDILNERFSKLPYNQEENYTKVEKMAILSATDALANAGVNPADPQVVFVFSTTKGNVELLEDLRGYEPERPYLWRSAQLVTRHFGNPNEPVVVSNACISGCAAQVAAARLLHYHDYRYAVVIGADVLSKFIISGFQSFKALSPELCRPFDADRTGLNLGEAAATIVYARNRADIPAGKPCLCLTAGAICNDANHISGPSRTAEGLFAAVSQVLDGFDVTDLAFVNAHGTATRYNDDMESVAMERAHLTDIPVNSLKGYFGHTLGAAGVLEVILSTQELLHHRVLRTVGCENPGTAAAVKVTQQPMETSKTAFLKMISGFGGGNAALLVTMGEPPAAAETTEATGEPRILAEATIDDISALLPDGTRLSSTSSDTKQWLSELYNHLGMAYPKFFKMDCLSKAGILAAEMVMRAVGQANEELKSDWGVVCFNSASSLDDDRTYQATIQDPENYFPSPSVFVYTLANIVAGEMAIKYKLRGETSFYVSEHFDKEKLKKVVADVFAQTNAKHLLAGWVDYDNGHCNVQLFAFEN